MSQHIAVDRFDAALWDRYGCTPDYLDRIERIRDLLPADTSSVLDVGCGRGEIADSIALNRPDTLVAALDPSMDAMQYPEHVRALVRAALPHVPFDDASFDVVVCLQVLEHLEASEYNRARADLLRVAARYILIGVPYRENLQTKEVRCAECGVVSHADGHVRSFNDADVLSLFDGAVLERRVLAGVTRRRQTRASAALGRLGGYCLPSLFRCPVCGSGRPAVSGAARRAAGAATGPLRWALTLTQPKLPYWVLALYRKSNV